jgi:hypothetical protein
VTMGNGTGMVVRAGHDRRRGRCEVGDAPDGWGRGASDWVREGEGGAVGRRGDGPSCYGPVAFRLGLEN